MRSFIPISGALLALAARVLAADDTDAPTGSSGVGTSTSGSTCSWNSHCGSSAPCCSEYGTCGSGPSYCLSGCNPQFSLSPAYCAPVPVCQSSNYTFTDASRIQTTLSKYMGNASQYDLTLDVWDGAKVGPVVNDQLVLALSEGSTGTRVSTTRSVLYGTIQANIKTVGAAGVVTAFITMSGTKDEIDWEWTTNNTNQAQTNYFWEGVIVSPSHGGTATAANRDTQFHTYGLVWTPSSLQWQVDGKTVRTLKKSDTYDSASGGYRYPQTPSRVQFSVWAAGVSSQPAGTVTWSGGMIDWDSAAYKSQGYYATYVNWISIDCYDGSDLDLTYQSSNATSTTSSAASKKTASSRERRALDSNDGSLNLWARAAQVVNSYTYGTNDSTGQIGLYSSDAGTVMDSSTSTGMKMITNSKSSSSGSSSGPAWWSKLPLAAKIGIVVGAAAVALLILVITCTIFARRGDKRRRAADADYAKLNGAGKPGKGGVGDAIPLVGKSYTNNKLAAPGGLGADASRSALSVASKDSARSYGNYAAPPSLGYSAVGGGQGQARQQNAYATPDYDYNAAFRSPDYPGPPSSVGSGMPSPRYNQNVGRQSYGGGGQEYGGVYQQQAYDGSGAQRPNWDAQRGYAASPGPGSAVGGGGRQGYGQGRY